MTDTQRFAWTFARYACLWLALLGTVAAIARWALGMAWGGEALGVLVTLSCATFARFQLVNDDCDKHFARTHRVDMPHRN